MSGSPAAKRPSAQIPRSGLILQRQELRLIIFFCAGRGVYSSSVLPMYVRGPTTSSTFDESCPDAMLERILKQYWGYDEFLPLQREAMDCAMEGRDSVVVLPTGGGKSLCYQAPAIAQDVLALVVSPLISLMKDQVDGLRECGVPAVRLDSSQTSKERGEARKSLQDEKVKLLYVSPERAVGQNLPRILGGQQPSLIAIDEAHCVSMWGHDFRPEYRALSGLRAQFPGASMHAFTATATPRVQHDIAETLGLENPEMLVGSFDRPNLIFRVRRREDQFKQVTEVLDRHENQSGIIYCLRRKDVDGLCKSLNSAGYATLPYHAGMGDAERKRNQDAFVRGDADTIVATVAFGMGIDKSNVRYVVHAAMPKSLEHYQQESGRAGRDGLEAECWLFYSGSDYYVWKHILQDLPAEPKRIALKKLSSVYRYCTTATCRHSAILNYFGQSLDKDRCEACDVCLGEIEGMEGGRAKKTAQKILSCVARLDQRYGGSYTADVLIGSKSERVLQYGHDDLSTWGLLSDYPKRQVQSWIDQLVGAGCLLRTQPYRVLKLTERGGRVLRGEYVPQLSRPPEKKTRTAQPELEGWEDVDGELFEHLRELRKKLADNRRVPAYIIFNDASLREMAARKPETKEEFLQIKGVGKKKCRQYAKTFLSAIATFRGG
ncbi:MAG: DNA helicase RecQ [Candidatus Brocadiia bacterium]